MSQKAAKTVDDLPPKQTSRTPAVKRDRGASGDHDSRPGKTFDLSQSVFPPTQSPVKHSPAAASRDENKTVSCCHY